MATEISDNLPCQEVTRTDHIMGDQVTKGSRTGVAGLAKRLISLLHEDAPNIRANLISTGLVNLLTALLTALVAVWQRLSFAESAAFVVGTLTASLAARAWSSPRKHLRRVARIVVIVMTLPLLAFVTGAATRTFFVPSAPVAEIGPMGGETNVAIAQIGQLTGTGVIPWADGGTLAEAVRDQVRKDLNNSGGGSTFDVRTIGPLAGETRDQREAAARHLAEQLRAQVIVYGTFSGQRVQPEFYVAGLSCTAQELVGAHQLGAPITVAPGGSKAVVGNALTSRAVALSRFLAGFEHLRNGNADSALVWFESAASALDQGAGRESLYAFIGSTLLMRRHDGDIAHARTSYIAALDSAKQGGRDFARAHIGLGNVEYLEFDLTGSADPAKLDTAAASYERALTAGDRSVWSYTEAKAHVGLGNVNLFRAKLGNADSYADAERHLQLVASAYQSRGQFPVSPGLASHAYLGLGFVAEFGHADPSAASVYYSVSLRIAPTKEVAEHARDGLRRVAPDAPDGYSDLWSPPTLCV